jgi:hypothetical protein
VADHADPHGPSVRRRPECIGQAFAGQQVGIRLVRQRSDVVDRVLHLPGERDELVGAVGGVAVKALGDTREVDAQRNETLLRAVVEVALDPLALVPDGDRAPRRRLGEPLQRRPELSDQACVLEDDEAIRRRRPDERRIRCERGIVDHGRQAPAVHEHFGHRGAGPALGHPGRPAALVHPSPRIARHPVHDAQRRILEGVRDMPAQLAGAGRGAQAQGQPLEHGGDVEAAVHQPSGEAQRDGGRLSTQAQPRTSIVSGTLP